MKGRSELVHLEQKPTNIAIHRIARGMTALPIDVCAAIFAMLDMDDLISAAQVCQAWREHINATSSLWQHAHFHYVLFEDFDYPNEQNALPVCHKPNVNLVKQRLNGQKLHSLHITANFENHRHSRTRARMFHFITETLGTLYSSEKSRALHLRLEGFSHRLIAQSVNTISRTRKVHQLDVITGGEQVVAAYLAEEILYACDIKVLRIYTMNEEPLPFAGGTAPSMNNVVDIEANDGNFAAHTDHATLVGLSVGVTLSVREQSGKDGSTEICPSQLFIPEGLQSLQLQRGWWNLVNTKDTILETLVCHNLWSLSGKRLHLELHCFKNLVRFHLSFDTQFSNDMRLSEWPNLLIIIHCTVGPTLEMLYLDLPAPIGGAQHCDYDDVWADRISKASKLQDLTLVNYFPSTLIYLGCDETKPPPPLRKFTLIGSQIYDEILFSCLPQTLPDLQVFDLSGTSFSERVPAVQKEEWLQRWQSVASVNFKPPQPY